MTDLYLILHKVRGASTFDIASKISGTDMWIIPTSGHRACPFWSVSLVDLLHVSYDHDEMKNLANQFAVMPPDWPDHYHCNNVTPLRVTAARSAAPKHTPPITLDDI